MLYTEDLIMRYYVRFLQIGLHILLHKSPCYFYLLYICFKISQVNKPQIVMIKLSLLKNYV